MICPKCKNNVKLVVVFSQCWQKAEVNEEGCIIEYHPLEEIGETMEIIHAEYGCGGELTDIIREQG